MDMMIADSERYRVRAFPVTLTRPMKIGFSHPGWWRFPQTATIISFRGEWLSLVLMSGFTSHVRSICSQCETFLRFILVVWSYVLHVCSQAWFGCYSSHHGGRPGMP